jgi:uncharacterized protein involved in exopolysaccharide biosynthesis
MAGRDNIGRRTLRELVRVVFAHRPLLTLCLLAGATIGGALALLEEHVYRGRLELISAAPSPFARYAYPDMVTLRRLILAPENLDQLLPPLAGEANAISEARRTQQRNQLRETLHIDRLVSSTDAEGTVWLVEVLIPADNHLIATQRLQKYAEQLQRSFAQGTSVAKRAPAGTMPWVVAKEPGPSPDATPAPPTAIAESIAAIRQSIASLETELAEVESTAERRRQALEDLQNAPQGETLPPSIAEDFPEVKAARDRLDQLLQRRISLAARVTPAHPSLRALDRSIETEKQQLVSGLAEAERIYRLDLTTAGGELNRIEKELEGERDKLARLSQVMTEQLVKESLAERQVEEEAIALETLPASQAEASPATNKPSAALPTPAAIPAMPAMRSLAPAQIVLPEPYVDASPVRPRALRDAVVGGMVGLLLGLIFLCLRSLSDQRVQGVADLQQLELEVFGSIPELKEGPPVQLGPQV